MENDIWNEISSFLNQLRCENINRESYIYFQELANIQLKKKMEKEKVNKLLNHINNEDREKLKQYGEILEELADGFFLLLVKEVVAVHDVLQFLQIAEELVGIYEVFVHVVEVADEQFSPEVEVIQSLFTVGLFAEHLIQFAYQADGVTGL